MSETYGLTPEDIAGTRRRGRPPKNDGGASVKAALPPKYMDPKSGKTWSGRGRAPAWLGKNPKRFLGARALVVPQITLACHSRAYKS